MSERSKTKDTAKKSKKTAMEAAGDLLASRMRTTAEMRKLLADKGYDSDEVDEAVSMLIGLRYLDDYEYAKNYYSYNASKKRGGRRAMRELEEKGVDKETIKFAFEDFMYESQVDEFKTALEIARREVFVTDDLSADAEVRMKEVDDKLAARVARKLETRGFGHDDIYRVLGEMRRWSAEDHN